MWLSIASRQYGLELFRADLFRLQPDSSELRGHDGIVRGDGARIGYRFSDVGRKVQHAQEIIDKPGPGGGYAIPVRFRIQPRHKSRPPVMDPLALAPRCPHGIQLPRGHRAIFRRSQAQMNHSLGAFVDPVLNAVYWIGVAGFGVGTGAAWVCTFEIASEMAWPIAGMLSRSTRLRISS